MGNRSSTLLDIVINFLPGGIQIEGLGSTDIDNQVEFQNSTAVGGLALELHRRLSKHYGRTEQLEEVISKRLKVPEVWKFESSVLERIIADWLAEYPSLVIIKVSPSITHVAQF